MSLYHSTGSNTTRFKVMPQTKHYQQKLTHMTKSVEALGRKLSEHSKQAKANTDNKKLKRQLQKDINHFESEIFKNPKVYQMFMGDYISQNAEIMGDFKDQISSCAKKIGSLDFSNLSPKKISSIVTNLFEDNIKDDALELAENIQTNFENHKKEIVAARVKQYYREQKLKGTELSMSSLTLAEVENYILNTPEVLNDNKGLTGADITNHEFNKINMQANTNMADFVDAHEVRGCPFGQCITETGKIDESRIKEAAAAARATPGEVYMGPIISTSDILPDVVYSFTPDELKNTFSMYLDCVAENFETISECTVISDVTFDYSQIPTMDENGIISETQTLQSDVMDDLSIQYDMQHFQPSQLETQELESVSVELPVQEYQPLVWETLGSDWYIQLLDMTKEKLPDTKLKISETIDTKEKALKTVEVLNKIREEENKREAETGEDCELLSGFTTTLGDKQPNLELLESFSKCLDDGGLINTLEISLPTLQSDGSPIPASELPQVQQETLGRLTEFATTAPITTISFSDYDYSEIVEEQETPINTSIFEQDGSLRDDINAEMYLRILEETKKKNSKEKNNLSFEYSPSSEYSFN